MSSIPLHDNAVITHAELNAQIEIGSHTISGIRLHTEEGQASVVATLITGTNRLRNHIRARIGDDTVELYPTSSNLEDFQASALALIYAAAEPEQSKLQIDALAVETGCDRGIFMTEAFAALQAQQSQQART